MIHAGNAITVQMLADGIAEFALTYKVSRSINSTVQQLKISKLLSRL